MMEQDVENRGDVCTTCLSSGRALQLIDSSSSIYPVFKMITADPCDGMEELGLELEQNLCWECCGLLKKFHRFRSQARAAQDHLRIVAMSGNSEDHSYMSQSLSALDVVTKINYDRIFFDYTGERWSEHFIAPKNTLDNVKNELIDTQHIELLETVPEIVLQNPMNENMGHILIRDDSSTNNLILEPQTFIAEIDTSHLVKGEEDYKTIEIGPVAKQVDVTRAGGYTVDYMTEEAMLASREQAKLKVQYASAIYKCELCVIGFYNQQQVEDHFIAMHRSKPGLVACKVCYVYIDEKKLATHVDQHYMRYECKICSHIEYSSKMMNLHFKAHMAHVSNSVIKIGDTPTARGRKKKKMQVQVDPTGPVKPGDLRKLLSKKTIEGYQCLECDMFFKNSRARKNHVQRFHREGLQCDHCKKRFVSRTTLATHMRLHEGPLPRDECPICHKQVRVIQLKYHIQRHQNKGRFECTDCNKTFSHLATYQAHLKYSRAHASEEVFKFPCPMCNKGYPTKEQMQDHFNYQHLGKTSHKCPICDKPIASRLNVEKHMIRIHGEKKHKPRNHICQQCGKAFTDKKALTQHEVIHSGDRPLECDVCHQTFKQKASLYTHKKRVHKIFPQKKVVEFMDKV